MKRFYRGFTLVELLVVIAIIAILAAVLMAAFNDARANARDEARKADLKQLQLAIELYRSQNGFYPAEGCGADDPLPADANPSTHAWGGGAGWTGPGPHSASWGAECDEYIFGLAPGYISELPEDPSEEKVDNRGFIYWVSNDGSRYKLLIHRTVEAKLISSYDDEFSRSPTNCLPIQTNVYAVYSAGAECI